MTDEMLVSGGIYKDPLLPCFSLIFPSWLSDTVHSEVQIFNMPCLPQVYGDPKGDYENDIPAELHLLHRQKVRIRGFFPLKILSNA